MIDTRKLVEIKPDSEIGDFDPKWDYNSDEKLEAIFIEVKHDIGKHKANVYTFEKKSGDRVCVWGSTVLDDRLKNLVKGEEVVIEYLGDKPTDKGNPYHDFRVSHYETVPTVIQDDESSEITKEADEAGDEPLPWEK